MEFVNLLDGYIEKLDKVASGETKEIEALIEDITRVILSQDELRDLCLDYYCCHNEDANLQADIRKLKAQLEYMRALKIDEQEEKRQKDIAKHEQQEIEKLRLQLELSKVNITIQNTNTNENNNTFNVTFDDARKAVDNMTSLSEEEIQEVKTRIDELETIVKSSDGKGKKWSKAKEIIKWIAEKGVDVGIAILPLLLQIK